MRMAFRRVFVVVTLVCGLCVWAFAHSGGAPVNTDPAPVEGDAGGTHDEAFARFRANQSIHWQHVAIGNASSDR